MGIGAEMGALRISTFNSIEWIPENSYLEGVSGGGLTLSIPLNGFASKLVIALGALAPFNSIEWIPPTERVKKGGLGVTIDFQFH